MGPRLLAPGIRFNDCTFTEPAHLAGWTPPKCAGLFGILVADLNWAPKPFQPLYFGEFGNNTPALPLPGIGDSLLAAAKGRVLLVSVLPLPFSTTSQRWALRNELVWAYNPVCQPDGTKAPIELARKLEDLEKRHHEQTAQVMQLLANVNRLFEPQPEPRRRSIGFLPQSEPTS